MKYKVVAFVEKPYTLPLDQPYQELVLYKTILKINQKYLIIAIKKLDQANDRSSISFKNELIAHEKKINDLIDVIEAKITIITICNVPLIKQYGGDLFAKSIHQSAPDVCIEMNYSNINAINDLDASFKSIEQEGQRMSQRIMSERIGVLVRSINKRELLQVDVDKRIDRLMDRRELLIGLMQESIDAITTNRQVTSKELKRQLIEQIINQYNPLISEINSTLELLRAYAASGAESSAKTIKEMKNSVALQLEIIDGRIELNARLKSEGSNQEYYNNQNNNLEKKRQMFLLFEDILNRGDITITLEEKIKLKNITGHDFDDLFLAKFDDNFLDMVKGVIAGEDIINRQMEAAGVSFGIERLNDLQQLISSLHVKSHEADIILVKITRASLVIGLQMAFELKAVDESNVSDTEKEIMRKSIKERYEPILEILKESVEKLELLAVKYDKLELAAVHLIKSTLEEISKKIELGALMLTENEMNFLIDSINMILNRESDTNLISVSLRNENLKSRANLAILQKILAEKLKEQFNILEGKRDQSEIVFVSNGKPDLNLEEGELLEAT